MSKRQRRGVPRKDQTPPSKAQYARLLAAAVEIARYQRHEDGCNTELSDDIDDDACDCGLREANEALDTFRRKT